MAPQQRGLRAVSLAREMEGRGRGASAGARERSYGGNFQASGFPGNLWRGHSLDRHEQCSPSFIRACYRPEPFDPRAGVTRVYVNARMCPREHAYFRFRFRPWGTHELDG